MTKSVEEQMADIERRMKQLRARKQRIVARENAKARKRRTHLIIRLGGILSNEGVLGYDEGVWNDEGNRQRLLDMLKAHAAELRAWASDAGVRLPSAESAGELVDVGQEPFDGCQLQVFGELLRGLVGGRGEHERFRAEPA